MRWAKGRRGRLGLAAGVVLAVVLVAVVVVAMAVTSGPPPSEAADQVQADKVLVLSLPGLDWALVAEERPPVLSTLLVRSAVASLSVRTEGTRTSRAEGYATVGAGTRAVGAGEGTSLVSEADVSPPVVSALGEVEAANRDLAHGAEPGSLGRVLAAAGRTTAVVANADVTGPGGVLVPHREAALALMDGQGRVDAGTVGPELSVEDPAAAGGRRADAEATAAAFSAAWSAADVVLLEAADLARAALAPGGPGTEQARRASLARTDRLLAEVMGQVDLDRHLVLVVAPVSARPGGDGLTVAAAAGPGVAPGTATSASTNRAGYVVLTDVAPTVLGALELEVAPSMTGSVLRSTGSPPPGPGSETPAFEVTLDALVRAEEVAGFRDDATGPASVAFVAFQLLTYALAATTVLRWPRLAPVVGFCALVTLAQPSLAFLSGLVRYDGLGVVGYVVALFAAGAALAALALALARASAARTGRARPLVAPLLLVAATVVVLVADVLAGGRLQLGTVFGYSAVVAGRFHGYGNLAFALVSMGALVVVTGTWGLAALVQGRPEPHPRRLWLAGAAGLLALVVVVDGHPALGADVGGVLALVPAALVALALLAGARVRPVQGLAIAAAAVTTVAFFAALDLARPPDRRTHLGRFAAQVLDGGEGVGTVIERKLGANLSLLRSSVWTLAIPVVLAALALLVRRRPGGLRRLEAAVPGLRAGLVAALVLAVLGAALNDSGVAVPAMMLAVVLPYLTVLAVDLAVPPGPPGRADPLPPARAPVPPPAPAAVTSPGP